MGTGRLGRCTAHARSSCDGHSSSTAGARSGRSTAGAGTAAARATKAASAAPVYRNALLAPVGAKMEEIAPPPSEAATTAMPTDSRRVPMFAASAGSPRAGVCSRRSP